MNSVVPTTHSAPALQALGPVAVGKASNGDRMPSAAERLKENATGHALLGDLFIFLARIPLVLSTGSMTLLSDMVRSAFTFSASINAYLVMRAMHRNRLSRFEFGIGKIEQFVIITVGLGLTVSSLWLLRGVVDTVLVAEKAASPLGLAAAALFNAVNLTKNFLNWRAMTILSRRGNTEIFRVQLRTRLIMTLSTLFLQVTLTAAALAKDNGIGLLLDATGACFVAGLMLYNGVAMICGALPNLLDSPAAPEIVALIRQTVAQVVPDGDVAGVRTRRSGAKIFTEVSVFGAPSVSTLHEHGAAIARALGDTGQEIEVTVVLAPAPTPNE